MNLKPRAICAAIGFASPAAAATYKTVIDFVPTPTGSLSGTAVDGNRITITWATNQTTGVLTENAVTDLTFELSGTNGVVFTDAAIIGGVVQDLGTINRGIANILFTFEFNTDSLINFDNDYGCLQQGVAGGVTYDIFGSLGTAPFVAGSRYVDGVRASAQSVFSANPDISTQLQVAPVLLPSAVLVLADSIATLGLVARRKSYAG